jgi:hypothetical protein
LFREAGRAHPTMDRADAPFQFSHLVAKFAQVLDEHLD